MKNYSWWTGASNKKMDFEFNLNRRWNLVYALFFFFSLDTPPYFWYKIRINRSTQFRIKELSQTNENGMHCTNNKITTRKWTVTWHIVDRSNNLKWMKRTNATTTKLTKFCYEQRCRHLCLHGQQWSAWCFKWKKLHQTETTQLQKQTNKPNERMKEM